ncbi:MAG TPA: hypothetical protein VEX16_03770 [Methyloceanibacter sp.]|nr:hypothetical protein [Methyloceanibacter sp.]
MSAQELLLGGFAATVALSLIIGAWGRRRSSRSLISFFWGDNNLSVAQGTHLNLSTSFAINGVLYSAWLGYVAGLASLLPQLFWCAGFLFLSRYSKRLGHLSRTGTLHGNIGYVFGKSAAAWAALASIIGFTLLFGWELYIGASMFRAVMPEQSQSAQLETILYFSLAAIAAIYCMLGGLRGNLQANQFQNYLSGGALVLAIVYLGWFATGTQHFSWSDMIDVSTVPALAVELTIAGMITNAVLFLVYQFLDMSVWQNIASVADERKKPRKTLWFSAFWILIFPGLTGSMLGMVMRSFETGVDPNSIVPLLLEQVMAQPVIFVVLVMGFFAMMLSTVDGLLLAACQAVTWDLTDRKSVLQILTARGTPDLDEVDIAEPQALAAKLAAQGDSVSKYLWDRFPPDTQAALKQTGILSDGGMARLLAEALNAAVKTEALFEPARFEGKTLSSEAKSLIDAPTSEADRRLLNRWLLEEAYPNEIAYNQFSNTLRREQSFRDPDWFLREEKLKSIEARTLDRAKYAIFLIALIGGGITLYLVRRFDVDAFNLLYITYVAQMSLFPTIWVIINGERRLQPRGAASIGLGLLAGYAAVIYGLNSDSSIALWAPTIAVAVACAVYWPFRRISTEPVSGPGQ